MGFVTDSLARRFAPVLVAALALLVAGAVPVAIARPTPDSFADLADQLLPTVVNIATTETLKPGSAEATLPDLPPGSPLQDLFKDFLEKNKGKPQHVAALGSGFVIDPSGLIVTNNHVIEDADTITVTLNDGTTLPATLVARDDKTDLALVRVRPKTPLPAAHFGDSDHARVGDWVIAIGDPFGLGSSVTAGIVSARNRDIAAGPYDDFIQTDAPINRGNSGGPLFDMDGKVIGIASAIFSPSGGSVGVGFAIPSNMAQEVISQLRQYGQTRRGWMGVRIQPLTGDIADSLGIASHEGALVYEVTVNGPAAKAGVQNGDVITGFDGKPVPDSRTLPRMVAETPAGKTVSIEVLRNGRRQDLQMTVAKLDDSSEGQAAENASIPATPKAASKFSRLGFALAPLDRRTRAKYKLGESVDGVVITDVDPDSPAGEKDIRAGDVIVQVQNDAVSTPDEVSRHIEADVKAGRKAVLLLVNRDGQLAYVAIRLSDAG
ncbi:MAG TPA: DegQ family serine endoprotease [Rhizomicrobium sp.]|jgi:serine protease Do|nr:DegQ family serine endoprotease [Rhizomicrobium sp.]